MAGELQLKILDRAQRALWNELGATPDSFLLYGGTAIALRLGHRKSVDFDFFTDTPFDPTVLLSQLPYLAGGQVFQQAKGTLSVAVDRGEPVRISFFCPAKPMRVVGREYRSSAPRIRLAPLIDLAATKLNVISQRASAKDYLDIHALTTEAGIDLLSALAAVPFVFEGQQFNPFVAQKALTYFDDMELRAVPAKVRRDLTQLAAAVDMSAYDATVAKYRGEPSLWRDFP